MQEEGGGGDKNALGLLHEIGPFNSLRQCR
jgi:hypothetical protein